MSKKESLPFVIGLGVIIALALLPMFGAGYYVNLFTIIFYWIGLAGCWNLMCGYTGYIDFGSAAYTGVGSYVAGVLMVKTGVPLVAAVAAAGFGAALLALVVGLPTLRLRGAYFAIATFALAEALMQVTEQWTSLTGGGIGITVPQRLDDTTYYWTYLLLAGVLVGLTKWIEQHKLGYGLKAIRENEEAAARTGVNTLEVKLKTYVLTSFFIGLLGALESTRLGYFTPGDVFDVRITVKMIIMSLLGGMGTVLGPVIGASFLQWLEDVLGAALLDYYLVIIGFIIVMVIMFLPRGIAGSFRRKGKHEPA